MRRSDWERLRSAGIKVAEFFPALLGNLQLRVNYRNHRKIVVIDGRIGFIGGFNIGREYLGKSGRFGYWRDTHICIEGSAVTSLAVRFVLDWNYAAGENLFLEDRLFALPEYVRGGKDPVQIISSGPDSSSKEIRDNYLRLIHMAQRSIYIQTPYFIPDDDIRDALIIAAKSGIDVRIMIPKYLCIKQEWRDQMTYLNHFYMDYLGQSRYVGILQYVYEGITYYFIDNEGYFSGANLTATGCMTWRSSPSSATRRCRRCR